MVMPPALTVAREMPSPQASDGGLLTGGGGGGGGGVGAVGDLLQLAAAMRATHTIHDARNFLELE